MRYRRFGATDLTVSEIGFGCARLGGIFQDVTKTDILKTLDAAVHHGITFFDTSDMYCQGESEELLGIALRKRRSDVVIASKVGYCLPARRKIISRIKPVLRPILRGTGIKPGQLSSKVRGSLSQDFSSRYIIEAVEHSLRRLRTDYLDLYQLHSPPADVLESGDFLEPLEKLKRDGKIRYFGVSCESTPDALTCLRYAEISSLQIRISLLDQSALEDVIPRAKAQGVSIIARECFAGGLLAKPQAALGLEAIMPDEAERDAKRREIASLHQLADQSGRFLTQLALQFILGIEGISVTLLGMRTEAQLRDNMHQWAAPPLSNAEMHVLHEMGAA